MLLEKIGIIHSKYKNSEEAPKQGRYSDEESTIEIFSAYTAALDGLEKIESIVVLYWADKASREVLKTRPPFMTEEYGVFSTRSPHRPNPISMCICNVISIENNKIKVKGLDAIDGSPLLDIKRYISRVDTDKIDKN